MMCCKLACNVPGSGLLVGDSSQHSVMMDQAASVKPGRRSGRAPENDAHVTRQKVSKQKDKAESKADAVKRNRATKNISGTFSRTTAQNRRLAQEMRMLSGFSQATQVSGQVSVAAGWGHINHEHVIAIYARGG